MNAFAPRTLESLHQGKNPMDFIAAKVFFKGQKDNNLKWLYQRKLKGRYRVILKGVILNKETDHYQFYIWFYHGTYANMAPRKL